MQAVKAMSLEDDPMEAFLQAEIRKLRLSWDDLLGAVRGAPKLAWEDWKEALLDLTTTPSQELLVRGALAALIKTAEVTLPSTTHRRLLMLAIRTADPNFASPRWAQQLHQSGENDMP